MAFSAPVRTKPIAAVLLQVLLFIAVCLPTGSIFGLNVKILVFAAFFAAFVSYLVASSVNLTSAEVIGGALFVGALCLWSIVAILNGQSEMSQVFLHMKDIATTVVIAWLCIFFVRRGILRPESIIAPVIYGVAALSLMKLAIVVAVFGSGADPVEALNSVFGEGALVGGDIGFGLTRLQFSPDIIGSFALFAILCPSVSGLRFRRISIVFLIILLVASGLLAYARYIWFLEAFCVVAAMVIERRFKLLGAVALATVLTFAISYEPVQTVVESRFFSDQTTDSDTIRAEQSRLLFEEIKDRPFFGKGLGTHINSFIRSDQNRYSYELQWMSLFMQFGAAGIVGILFLLHASARDLLASRHRAKPWVVMLFVLWLLSGWTNPYLLSSFAGATFGMFIVIFHRIRNSNGADSEFHDMGARLPA